MTDLTPIIDAIITARTAAAHAWGRRTTRGLHRCWACADPWVGVNVDAENRCPVCIAHDRHPPPWFEAWRRSLQLQGRLPKDGE